MLALTICLLTGLIVWLWLVWDMTREIRAGWGRGAAKKPKATLPQPGSEPPEKPARDPRDWMSD